jgi:hypothetical protein
MGFARELLVVETFKCLPIVSASVPAGSVAPRHAALVAPVAAAGPANNPGQQPPASDVTN